MIPFDPDWLSWVFVVFCRIGACMAFAPGLSSPRIPVRARLVTAVALTLALSPGILESGGHGKASIESVQMAIMTVREISIGAAMGVLARLFFALFEMMLTAASMSIGANSSFAMRVDEADAIPEFASLIAFSTTSLFFLTGMHWEIVGAVHDSYTVLPLGSSIETRFALGKAADTLSIASSVTFRLAAPFIFFGLVANFGFALANRMIPQVAIYFVAAPIVLFSGLSMLSMLWTDMATLFLSAFRDWLQRM